MTHSSDKADLVPIKKLNYPHGRQQNRPALFADELLCPATVLASENNEIWLALASFLSSDDHSLTASQAAGVLACVEGIEQKNPRLRHRLALLTPQPVFRGID